jgi:hypothetical protein
MSEQTAMVVVIGAGIAVLSFSIMCGFSALRAEKPHTEKILPFAFCITPKAL